MPNFTILNKSAPISIPKFVAAFEEELIVIVCS